MRGLLMLVASLLLFSWEQPSLGQNKVKDLQAALQALKSRDAADRAAGMYFLAEYGRESKAYSRDIVSGLLDPSPDVRKWAALGLPRANPDVAGPVLNLVQSKDYDKRKEAVQALAQLGEKGGPAVPALLAFLKDAQPSDRADIVKTLTTVGAKDSALPAVLVNMAVSDPDPAVRAAAAKGIPRMENHQAVAQAYAGLLQDPDPARRSAVLTSLADLDLKDTTHIVPVLQQALRDPSPTVRETAKKALDKLQRK